MPTNIFLPTSLIPCGGDWPYCEVLLCGKLAQGTVVTMWGYRDHLTPISQTNYQHFKILRFSTDFGLNDLFELATNITAIVLTGQLTTTLCLLLQFLSVDAKFRLNWFLGNEFLVFHLSLEYVKPFLIQFGLFQWLATFTLCSTRLVNIINE